ncbi:MAG: Hsp20/alpha crystallin family protein [Chitinophagaceae bacterium]
MSIIKRNGDLFPSMSSFFNDVFDKDVYNWNNLNFSDTGTTVPAVNIKETTENFEVEMASPGMTKDDFNIELDGNLLTITSEKKSEHQEKDNEKYSRKEFSYQSFQRTFQLPKEVVDADNINAKYENGVLRLLIPKREEVKQKPRRMISIS